MCINRNETDALLMLSSTTKLAKSCVQVQPYNTAQVFLHAVNKSIKNGELMHLYFQNECRINYDMQGSEEKQYRFRFHILMYQFDQRETPRRMTLVFLILQSFWWALWINFFNPLSRLYLKKRREMCHNTKILYNYRIKLSVASMCTFVDKCIQEKKKVFPWDLRNGKRVPHKGVHVSDSMCAFT